MVRRIAKSVFLESDCDEAENSGGRRGGGEGGGERGRERGGGGGETSGSGGSRVRRRGSGARSGGRPLSGPTAVEDDRGSEGRGGWSEAVETSPLNDDHFNAGRNRRHGTGRGVGSGTGRSRGQPTLETVASGSTDSGSGENRNDADGSDGSGFGLEIGSKRWWEWCTYGWICACVTLVVIVEWFDLSRVAVSLLAATSSATTAVAVVLSPRGSLGGLGRGPTADYANAVSNTKAGSATAALRQKGASSGTGAAAAAEAEAEAEEEEAEPAPGSEGDWIERLDRMRRLVNEEAAGGWVEPSAKNFKVISITYPSSSFTPAHLAYVRIHPPRSAAFRCVVRTTLWIASSSPRARPSSVRSGCTLTSGGRGAPRCFTWPPRCLRWPRTSKRIRTSCEYRSTNQSINARPWISEGWSI